MTEPKQGDLRVWWIPQVPMEPMYIEVKTIREARLVMQTLGEYDDFQYQNSIKPDYSNAGGLEVYEADIQDWIEWYNDDDSDIDNVDDEGNTVEEE